jgi:hypothetical protein
MTATEKLHRSVNQTNGTITAANDEGTRYRIEFPLSTRAASFYDDAITYGWEATYQDPARCVVVVNL